MELIIYPRLNKRSKIAMTRIQKKYGWYYHYEPRHVLVCRLARELNMSEFEVREQIRKERNFIIDNQQYF